MDGEISGERIKALRQERGISADELGRLIGKNRATVYRYEDGSIDTIPIKTVRRIAEVLDVKPSYLMGLSDKPEPLNQNVIQIVRKNDKYAEIKTKILEQIDSCSESEIAFLLETLDLLAMRSRQKKDSSTDQDSSLPPVT